VDQLVADPLIVPFGSWNYDTRLFQKYGVAGTKDFYRSFFYPGNGQPLAVLPSNPFLGSPFCATAVALGWGPYDLFGCDRDRPFARIDQLGLLWLLDGGRLAALTADTAMIKTSNGSILTYRRRIRKECSKVLAWELQ
jgi:hypothetical protein